MRPAARSAACIQLNFWCTCVTLHLSKLETQDTRLANDMLSRGHCCAGFRNCGIIHMTWTNLLYEEADQRVLPQAFDILGIGINKHKTNMTGKIEWTGITRHVRADCDPFFALANLMAHEIEVQNLRFIDMLQSTDVYEQQL